MKQTAWRAPALLLLATFAAYSPVLKARFIWDDDDHITNNVLLTAPGGLRRIWTTTEPMQYYPLTFTAFWLEHRAWGFDPLGYHLINVLLHAANALLLALILKRLRVPAPWWAAAFFALHPVNVESVAWATELKNVLSGFFFLASVHAYLVFEDLADARAYLLSLACFALALLSKTSTCLLPGALLVLDWARRRPLDRRSIVRLIPFGLIGGGLAAVTVVYERVVGNAADPHWALTRLQRLILSGQTVCFYALKLAAPVRLSFIYRRWTLDPSALVQWLPLAAAVATAAALWLLRRRLGRAPLAGGAIFVLMLFPVMGFFDVYFMRFSYVADHFQYLAGFGLLSLVPAAIERLTADRARRRAVLGALAVVLGLLTWNRAQAFGDGESLWRDTLARNPEAWMAWNNLAGLELASGRWAEAAADERQALRFQPNYGDGWFNLGMAVWNQGKLDEAVGYFKRSIEINPKVYHPTFERRRILVEGYLGAWEAKRGHKSDSLAHFRTAAALSPSAPWIRFNLAGSFWENGRAGEARAECAKALALSPADPGGELCRALLKDAGRR
jgi:tetratricopeptide (TPR) repeat protein